MSKTNRRFWLIYLLLFGIHIITTYSYGDLQFIYDDNGNDVSEKITFDKLVGDIHNRHRVRRALGDPTSKKMLFIPNLCLYLFYIVIVLSDSCEQLLARCNKVILCQF
jgi:hypothetical protein